MIISEPNRVSHTFKQTIKGMAHEIMPLFCPVRELDWCENWNPKAVYSYSGLVEKDCVFITPDGKNDIVWIVTDFDVKSGHVEMYYHVPEVLVTKLEIQVKPITKNTTEVEMTYSKTAISDKGNKALMDFTEAEFNTMMRSWEKAMNHYLATGEILTGLPNF